MRLRETLQVVQRGPVEVLRAYRRLEFRSLDQPVAEDAHHNDAHGSVVEEVLLRVGGVDPDFVRVVQRHRNAAEDHVPSIVVEADPPGQHCLVL